MAASLGPSKPGTPVANLFGIKLPGLGDIVKAGIGFLPGGGTINTAINTFGGGGGSPISRCPDGRVADSQGRCPGIQSALERFVPGGRSGMGIAQPFPPALAPATSSGCPSGWHPNRSSYWTQGGFVEKGTRCVRNRRRNNLNPKAAMSSARRLIGFGKDVKKVEKGLKAIAGRR